MGPGKFTQLLPIIKGMYGRGSETAFKTICKILISKNDLVVCD